MNNLKNNKNYSESKAQVSIGKLICAKSLQDMNKENISYLQKGVGKFSVTLNPDMMGPPMSLKMGYQ